MLWRKDELIPTVIMEDVRAEGCSDLHFSTEGC